MSPQKSKIIGRYGRPQKKKSFHLKFRFSRKLFYLALAAAILWGIFYFLFVSDRFEIKEIKVSGLDGVDEGEVMGAINTILNDKKFVFLKAKNYLLFSDDKLRAHILSSFSKIATVDMERTLDKLNIKIEEREVIGVWCKGGDCFYFDKEGIIFEESPRSSGALMIVIEDERDLEAKLGSAALSMEQVAFAAEAQRLVSRNFPFHIRTFLITKDGAYELVTSEGWRMLLDKSAGAEYQISNLKYVLDEVISAQGGSASGGKTRRGELEYVDLRLGNRVYFKFHGE